MVSELVLRSLLKPSTGIGRGRGSKRPWVHTVGGELQTETVTTHNVGFGDFDRSTYQETPEGRRMMDIVQKSPVGTEITLRRESRFGPVTEETYRVTGITNAKRLVSISGVDEPVSIPLTERSAIMDIFAGMFYSESDKHIVRVQRKPMTRQERRDARWEREVREAAKRQRTFNF